MIATVVFAVTAFFGDMSPVMTSPVEPALQEVTMQNVRTVPFYSQFTDVSDPAWQKVSCGIASLAMVLEYHTGEKQSVDDLLTEGRRSGAYEPKSGWIHTGLLSLAQKRGLHGTAYNLHASSTALAFDAFKDSVRQAPTIVSVQYDFKRSSALSHLIVAHRIENDTVYYNDPASEKGVSSIGVQDFLGAWNKRFILLDQSI